MGLSRGSMRHGSACAEPHVVEAPGTALWKTVTTGDFHISVLIQRGSIRILHSSDVEYRSYSVQPTSQKTFTDYGLFLEV